MKCHKSDKNLLTTMLYALGGTASESKIRLLLDKSPESSLAISAIRTSHGWDYRTGLLYNPESDTVLSMEDEMYIYQRIDTPSHLSNEENIMTPNIWFIKRTMDCACAAVESFSASKVVIFALFRLYRKQDNWCGEVGIMCDGEYGPIEVVSFDSDD